MTTAPHRKPLGWLQLVLAVPIAIAIAHIIATFRAEGDQRNSAFSRLSRTLKPNVMTVLDPVAPGRQPLPFLGPDARYAMCLFSTDTGPVRVSAALPEVGWTLGVYKKDGTSAYFAAAAPGRETAITLTVVPDDDRFLGMTPQALGQSIDVTPQLSVGAREGIVVLRAPDSGLTSRETTQRFLSRAACSVVSY